MVRTSPLDDQRHLRVLVKSCPVFNDICAEYPVVGNPA